MCIKDLSIGLAALGLGFGLAGCAKDGDTTNVGPVAESGQPTTITVSVGQPRTYATDPNAIAAETRFKTVDVFIYNTNSVLVTHAQLDGDNDFDVVEPNKYTSNKRVETTTGAKEVYIGVNLPSSVRSTILQSKMLQGVSAVNNISVSDLTDATEGFAMFSTTGIQRNFVPVGDPSEATENMVTAEVKRLVAKISVEQGSALMYSVAGGTVSDLEFAMRNSNKLIYPLQQTNSAGVIVDPNWFPGDWNSADFQQFSDYVGINPYNTDVDKLNVKYAPENTSQLYYTRETTYASVKGIFNPAEFYDEDGESKGQNSATGKSFWVVQSPTHFLYFDNATEAKTFADNNDGTVSKEYKNGEMYWNLFLNPKAKYNTYRNDFYRLTINSIKGLGNPDPGDEGDTDKPVQEETLIDFTIIVVPWNVILEDYDLI